MATRSASSQSLSDLPSSLPQFLRQDRPTLVNKFNYLETLQRDRLTEQYENPEKESEWARLTGDHIAYRNRYVNVEPFANNRVKLNVAKGFNDYINASPIVLGPRHYIATQGPKNTSTSQFYRMLAQESTSNTPAVVVMLTQTHEAGREKCFKYFPDTQDTPLELHPDPDLDDGFEGNVELLSAEEDTTCRCTIRHLRLHYTSPPAHEGEERHWNEKDIYHLLFVGWPDFSVPEGENRNAMLNLISKSATLNLPPNVSKSSSYPLDAAPDQTEPSTASPRIIHCSAGVGRSGTFIALDFLLAHLEQGNLESVPDDVDPILDTVNAMRKQRMMMVQSEAQFLFLYDVMRLAWLEQHRAADAEP
ncbi:receptor/non-receptor type protein-tyrosine phosphatase, partial [Aureobasidium melanogenum]